MKIRTLAAALFCGGSFATFAPCFAHGAQWPPPPIYRGPVDTGKLPRRLITPAASAAPSPATAPLATGTSGLSQPVGTGSPQVLTDACWYGWWWECHKEPFLDLKRRLGTSTVLTGSDGFFLGHGYREQRVHDSFRPTQVMVRDRVVPALIDTLERESSNDVITACLVALGRVGDDQEAELRGRLGAVIETHLRSANQEVRETAACALGILASPSSARPLSDLALDTEVGRQAVGSNRVSNRTRAFAAYGLGLIGLRSQNEDVRRFIVHRLAQTLSADSTPTPDLGTACVLALGRIPLAPNGVPLDADRRVPATASREAQVHFLFGLLDDEQRHRIVKSHVPTALAHLASAEPRPGEALRVRVAERVLAELEERRSTREMQQSCVIALGRIGDNDDQDIDVRIRRRLLSIEAVCSDRHARNLAYIALGRIAARAGEGPPHGVQEVRRELLEGLARGNDRGRWCALGLALLERDAARAGRAHPDVSAALLEALADARSGSDAGAAALACGLLGAQEAVEELLRRVEGSGEERARGHAAIALGLLEARAALEPLRRVLGRSIYRPDLLRDVAIALGLLGDRQLVGELVDQLGQARSLAAQASVAQALGRIGDGSAIEPLLTLASDGEKTAAARAFAIVAVGIVADQDPLPWNVPYSVGVNYAAAPPTLYDAQGFGILNIL